MNIGAEALIALAGVIATAASIVAATAWQTRHQGKKLHQLANDVADVKLLRQEVVEIRSGLQWLRRAFVRVAAGEPLSSALVAAMDEPNEGGE